MPTRHIELTAEQDAFVEEMVQSGKYQDASEAVRDAVRTLQLRLQVDELKIEILRTHLKAGVDALDRGDFTELNDDGLDAALDALTQPATR
jgi:antitoxin ParD1/3/4